jgi:hypothetical protein
MDAARADLRHWAGAARDEITGLPAGSAKDALAALCEFVAERTS